MGATGQGTQTGSELDFGRSSGLAEGIGPGTGQDEAPFRSVALMTGQHRGLFTPERVAHRREGVDEGRPRFGVPCRRRNLSTFADRQTAGKLRDDRKQREQAGCGAGDGLVRPLQLGLYAEVSACLRESDLYILAPHEPGHDLRRLAVEVGAKWGLRCKAVLGIAHQHQSDRHDR